MLKINMIYTSRHPSNTKLNWCSTDSEDRYLLNREHQPKLLKEHGWWDHEPFEYRFNSQGFRGPEFQKKGIIALGCSNTLGVGLPEECTWPSIVAKMLDLPCNNLGQNGGAMDTCFRLAQYWIPQLQPKLVVLLPPHPSRIEITEVGGKFTFINPTDVPKNYKNDHYYKQWIANSQNEELNYQKNLYGIKYICQQNHTSLIEFDYLNLEKIIKNRTFARDLMHSGKKNHQDFADMVLEKIKKTSV